MTIKAIKFFEDEIRRLELAPELNGCDMTEEWKEQIEICKAAKSALEKQIPKKPLPNGEKEIDPFGRAGGICPTCGFPRLYDNNDFCGKCGQALDWGDGE